MTKPPLGRTSKRSAGPMARSARIAAWSGQRTGSPARRRALASIAAMNASSSSPRRSGRFTSTPISRCTNGFWRRICFAPARRELARNSLSACSASAPIEPHGSWRIAFAKPWATTATKRQADWWRKQGGGGRRDLRWRQSQKPRLQRGCAKETRSFVGRARRTRQIVLCRQRHGEIGSPADRDECSRAQPS